jgi:uncharacterized protein
MTNNIFANPFVAGGKIENPSYFVGRKDELNNIISLMTGAQSTSINVVGEKRLGKSSLLYNFFLTWEQRVQDNSRYTVIFLSLQSNQCQREKNFYQEIAQELLNRPTIKAKQSICSLLQTIPFERSEFSQGMKKFKEEGILPVLCLDDFEELFERTSEFNNDFYDNLRSLMDNNFLMLVLATKKSLDFYSKKHKLTSSFFNLGHILKLKEFKDDEVKDLLCSPANKINNHPAILSIDEQQLARQLAGNHPFLLQIACRLCYEARQQGQNKNWVKKQFAQELKRLPKNKRRCFGQGRFIWDIFSAIGNFGLWLVEFWNSAKAAVLGFVFLLSLILILFGFLNPDKAKELLGYLLNLTK